jgi:HEAT repeat protein
MTSARYYPVVLAFGTALLTVAGTTLLPKHARAADGEPSTKGASVALVQRFQSRDQVELLMLLDELGKREPEAPKAARAVSELLATGQADVVTDHALETLGRLGVREGREALIAYTHHRRAETRRRAYTALAQLKDASAASVESQGLRDSAPEVRSAAALALGELRASAAAPDLLRALGRGVHEAAAALGKLGDAASVDAYGAYLGKQPLDVMLAGYANYLQRADLRDAVKLRIVAALEDVSGSAVKRFLSELIANNKPPRSPELQRAMVAAVSRIKSDAAAPARAPR